MLEKIMKNMNKIFFVACVVSTILVIYNLTSSFNSTISDSVIVSYCSNACIIAANIILACVAAKNNKLDSKALALPIILFFGGLVLPNIYTIVAESGSYSTIAFVALYVAIIVVYFISLVNKKANLILLIVLITVGCIRLSNVFSGSYIAIAYLSTMIILAVQIYLNYKGENSNE